MTVRALSNALKGMLVRAGVDNPDGDMLCIMETLGFRRVDIMIRGGEEIDEETHQKAIELARRRASGEPIQYVIGSWSFMGRDYTVGEGVLIPRDDTEVVTRAALGKIDSVPSPVVVDLCSGSGIIAVTLKKERGDAEVTAVEKSDGAFGYLKRNCEQNGADVRLIHADLTVCADEFEDNSIDMIVSNPPYIRSDEIAGLQSEVRFEPRLALDGGSDGYDFYRMILDIWSSKLKKGGHIAFEIGEGQFDAIADMMKAHGFSDIEGYRDIQDTVRAATGIYG